MRKIGLILLMVLIPLGMSACANRERAPDVTEAQAKLHEAEKYFASAQTAIIRLARVGVLKGQALAAAKKAEGVAYAAIKVARAAVDRKDASALRIVSEALVQVLALVATYAPK